jgi:O-antigen/teichoic acid export membrane protein
VLITLPGRSVSKISIPFLAEAWKKDDLATIDYLYSRSSIGQYTVGLLIFIGLMVNMDNIFRLLPDAYSGSGAVIILIGLGYLVSVSAGVNSVLLSTSSLYRFQTWLMLVLIGLFVITNVIFIPLLGITGAALAAMVSNIIYSLLGVLLTGRRFGLWPYSMTHLKITLLGLTAMIAGYLIPQLSLVPDILLRSLLVTLIFAAGVWYWKLSDDFTGMADRVTEWFRKRL